MADHGEKPAFSRRQLDAAELAQTALRPLRGLGRAATWLAVGSLSPAYVQIHWQQQPQIAPDSIATVTAKGDSRAGVWPQAWGSTAVFGMNAALYADLQEDYPDGRPAVGYLSEDVVRIGELPAGHDFGFSSEYDYRLASARLGRGPLQFTMGLWLTEDKQLITPGVEIIERSLPLFWVPRWFPNTPTV